MDITKALREELARVERSEPSHQRAELMGIFHGAIQTITLADPHRPVAPPISGAAEGEPCAPAASFASDEQHGLTVSTVSETEPQPCTPSALTITLFVKHGAVARRLRWHCKTLAMPIVLNQEPKSNLKQSGGYNATLTMPIALWQDIVAHDAYEQTESKPNHLGTMLPPGHDAQAMWNTFLPLCAKLAPYAYLSGLAMATCSLSKPYQPVHFQLVAPTVALARELTDTFGFGTGRSKRIVLKHGEKVANVLKEMGALSTLDTYRKGRSSLDLRKQANRATNADRANLNRTSQAAGKHIRAIEGLVDEVGWDGIPENLQKIALARLVNPEASLIEIGELMQPALSKAATHRRLNHLVALYDSMADEMHQ